MACGEDEGVSAVGADYNTVLQERRAHQAGFVLWGRTEWKAVALSIGVLIGPLGCNTCAQTHVWGQ